MKIKRLSLWQFMVFLCLLLSLGPSLADEGMVVTTEKANLRSGPSSRHPVIGVVRQGERLFPERFGTKYALVRLANGEKAYIYWPDQNWKADGQNVAKLASGFQADALPAGAKATEPGRVLSTSLADIGFRYGHHFEGAHSAHAHTFFFPIPMDGVKNGVLKLRYRVSGALDPLSSLRVDLNDHPARQIALNGNGAGDWLEIPVGERDLSRDHLKVTIRAILVATRDRCFDERALALHFVDLLPESRFETGLSGAAQTLRSAWATLPNPVRVYLPVSSGSTGFATALEAGVLLHRMNRRITFVGANSDADIVIDKDESLAARFPGFKAAPNGAGGSALVDQNGRRPVILISDRVSPDVFTGLQPGWVSLLRGRAVERLAEPAARSDVPTLIDLAEWGLVGGQNVQRQAEWSAELTSPRVPGHMQAASVRLNFIGTPDPKDARFMLSVFLNGALQEVRALDITGKPQSVSIGLTAGGGRKGNNHLRIVINRSEQEGNCSGNSSGSRFELLPGSVLTMKANESAPRIFNDLRATFGRGLDLHVTRASLADAARLLPMLIGVFGNHEYPFDRSRVRIVEDDAEFVPASPFLLVGKPKLPLAESAVRLDRGAVRVLDADQKLLLAVNQLPGLSIAQLARHQGQSGLWLIPASEGPLTPASELFLDQDNVTFADERGIALTVDSRASSVSRIEYPEYQSWLDVIERYRFWLIAFGWAVLLVLLVQLYRKTRIPRKGN